jgi:hypothetical protein
MSNQSVNETTSVEYGPFMPLDFLIDIMGETWFFVFTIIGSYGTVFNILSFIVFLDRDLSVPLYEYLRVYTIHGAQTCFFSLFVFIANTMRMFEWSNMYWTHAYYTFVYVPFVTSGYFFGTYMDIVITVDRIGNFNKTVRGFMKLSAYKIYIIGCILCFLVDLPYCFAFVPQ